MRAVTPITIVMAYYENPGMLHKHYEAWAGFSPNVLEHMHVVIVDDGSPEHPANPPLPAIRGKLNVQIYRMTQDVRWNQDACRNIGVAHAETNWVLLTDIDHMVSDETMDYLIFHEWDAGEAYKFRRVSLPDMSAYKPHPNSWLMARKMFDAVGGYDERLAGFYGTDGDFRDRVMECVEQIVLLKQSLIRVPRQVIADASTTTYLRKQPEDRIGIERVMIERKELIASGEDWKPLRGSFDYVRVHP